MPIRTYPAIVDFDPRTDNWAIVFPDFPGVTSVAETAADIPRQAKDALSTIVEVMRRDDEDLPASIENGAVDVAYDRSDFIDPRIWMIPVEVEGRAMRINTGRGIPPRYGGPRRCTIASKWKSGGKRSGGSHALESASTSFN